MRSKLQRRIACMLLASAALALRPSSAHAYLIINWDLDTLVNRSTLIVEGEVVSVPGGTLKLRIIHVYRGSLKENDITNIEYSYFQKTDSIGFPTSAAPFDAGDRLVCFLSPRAS